MQEETLQVALANLVTDPVQCSAGLITPFPKSDRSGNIFFDPEKHRVAAQRSYAPARLSLLNVSLILKKEDRL